MKFRAGKTQFLSVLTRAHGVVEKRNTIPILSNVLIKAENRQVLIVATDLDLEVRLYFEAEVDEPGSTTVPAGLLFDIVRKLGEKLEITFKTQPSDQMAEISSGRSRFQLQCLPESDFPTLTAGQYRHVFDIDPALLLKVIKTTQFAISTEETRYYLNGIYLHTDVNKVGEMVFRGVATDGHRLAQCDVEAPSGSEGMPGVILPRKTVSEISKLLAGAKNATVSVSDQKICFEVDGATMLSKLIDGTFPDYKRVIPGMGNKVAIAQVKEFSQVSDRVATISSERGRAVKMTFNGNTLTMVVNNPDSGSAEEEMVVEYDADPIEIGFNAKYVNDILGNVPSEKVRIYLEDPGAPALIVPEGDSGSLFVIMPMRI